MKISELFESASSILYHVTTIHAASKILTQGKFNLSASVGTGAERVWAKGDRFYFLSTARNKTADYTIHNLYKTGVTFKLNGDWLNYRYKGAAMDYWEGFWQKMRASGGDKTRVREMEDRIYSRKPTIPLPSTRTDLITEIHILLVEINEQAVIPVRNIIVEAKRNNIPYFVYDDKEAMIFQDKRKAIPVNEIIPKLKKEAEKRWPRMKPRDFLSPYRELYHKSDRKDLSREASKRIYYIKSHGTYFDDEVRRLEADIHNSRSREEYQEGLYRLLQIFRKEKIGTPKEYLKFLRDKWEDIDAT